MSTSSLDKILSLSKKNDGDKYDAHPPGKCLDGKCAEPLPEDARPMSNFSAKYDAKPGATVSYISGTGKPMTGEVHSVHADHVVVKRGEHHTVAHASRLFRPRPEDMPGKPPEMAHAGLSAVITEEFDSALDKILSLGRQMPHDPHTGKFMSPGGGGGGASVGGSTKKSPTVVAHTRHENTSITHNKFHESTVHAHPDGTATHTVKFGSMKPGAVSSTKVTSHPTHESALAAHNKSVKTRQKHEYHEVQQHGTIAHGTASASHTPPKFPTVTKSPGSFNVAKADRHGNLNPTGASKGSFRFNMAGGSPPHPDLEKNSAAHASYIVAHKKGLTVNSLPNGYSLGSKVGIQKGDSYSEGYIRHAASVGNIHHVLIGDGDTAHHGYFRGKGTTLRIKRSSKMSD